ncbi:hypothetical protein JCGZ_11591 [Jatropha curcas]|uniref:Uncharacterized protein n=1 Tax=Jatropha curcas TaxID=180498 RepID=A0A067KG61_JATCU|nr:hypothetical protein JCGZ_11591 [Jatropha curcas]
MLSEQAHCQKSGSTGGHQFLIFTFEKKDCFSKEWFMNSVERVLLLHNLSCINSFSLKCSVLHDAFRVKSWVTAAAKDGIQKLSLHMREQNWRNDCDVLIFGTRLEVFKYFGKCSNYYTLDGISSVVEACIHVYNWVLGSERDADQVNKLLSALPNAKSMSLSSGTIKVLDCAAELFEMLPLPVFYNLAIFIWVQLIVMVRHCRGYCRTLCILKLLPLTK